MHLQPPLPERLLVDAFDLAGAGLAIVDAAGVMQRVNLAFATALGYSPAELAGRPFTDFFVEAARASALKVFEAALANGVASPSHWTLRRGDGSGMEALIAAQALGVDSGRYAICSVVDVSGLAGVEQRLSATLAEQKALLDNALVGILFTHAGSIVRLNARCAEMFGYRTDELIGRPANMLYPSAASHAAVARAAEPVLASGKPYHAEHEARRRDGSLFWIEVDAKPVNAAGEAFQTIWTIRDITDRRRTEAALASANREQQAILDNASVGVVFMREQHVMRCNRRMAELFGYLPEELVGQPGSIFYAGDESYALMGRLAGPTLALGRPYQTEFEFQRRDGSPLWCRVSAQAVNPEAPGEGTVWIIDDVTEERRAAESLHSTLAELELILANATVGIVFLRGGIVERCNRRHAEILGYEQAELLGERGGRGFESEAEYERFRGAVLPVMLDGRQIETEVRWRRKRGERIWVRLSGRLVTPGDPDGGSIWITQDVTAQREAQAALVRARAELEQRVHERTADIESKNVALESEISERRLAELRLRDHNERLTYHRNRLLELAQLDKADFDKALDRILGVAVDTLAIDRASFWRVTRDGNRIVCEKQYFAERGPMFSSAGALALDAEDHPAYFEAMRAKEVIVAPDAIAHPATASLAESYLVPSGVVSTVDIPVWLDGRVVGLVCLEALRTRRTWQAEDVDFASGVAVMVALALEASQRRNAEEQLRHLAHHDTLTGLPNRHLLQDRLKQALAFAGRNRAKVAVMFLDLDRFKTINDSLGHIVGDQLLGQVAERLTGALRAGDTVCRLGGDEFVIVLSNLKLASDAGTVAGHLLERIAPPFAIDGRELYVSGSIGISIYPDDADGPEALMRNADTAMYHVKESGRNGFQFFAATMNAAANRRLAVETELRAALRRNELELFYQPIVELETRSVRALEALVRWRHPQRGLLPPGAFVSIAEETGLIHQIGHWALGEACAQARLWQDAGYPAVPISVNLSARQFRERDFSDSVRAILQRTGLAPSLLEIEVTEHTLIEQIDNASGALDALAALGVQIAIDDFGVGYSSLSYLKRFAIDRVKIDRSFVRNIPADADGAAITAAIISMSKSLKLRVVAEGVENEQQLEFLAAHGCDEVQGYLFCRPAPASEAARLFGAHGVLGPA